MGRWRRQRRTDPKITTHVDCGSQSEMPSIGHRLFQSVGCRSFFCELLMLCRRANFWAREAPKFFDIEITAAGADTSSTFDN